MKSPIGKSTMTEITNDVRTADEMQAGQARRLSAAEREAADINAAAAKKRIAEEHHAGRLKGAQALYVGQREIKIVRKAAPDDIDYIATEAQSAVLFVATGVERVIHDSAINPMPTGVV
jgi:hypothetical protein